MTIVNLFRSYSPKQKKLLKYLRTYWGISAKKLSWYEQAMRHKSLIGSGKYDAVDCNERLELLGDAVLDTIITEHIFKQFPDKNEGYLTKIRSRIVNRQILGQVGKTAQLDTVIEARIGSVDSMDKIIGNAMEALIGAIYMDLGFAKTKACLEKYLIHGYIDLNQIINESQDFKSGLIEWAQQHKHRIVFDTKVTPEDDQLFECSIYLNGNFVSNGVERSKKKAEQTASKQAVKELHL